MDTVKSENGPDDTPVISLEGDSGGPVETTRAPRVPSLSTLHLRAIGWGLFFAVRTVVLLMFVSVIVVAPIVVFDSDSVFRAAAILDATTWGMLVINGIPAKLGAATFTLVPWGLAVGVWLLLYRGARSLARKFRDNILDTAIASMIFVLVYAGLIIAAAMMARTTNVSFGLGYTIAVVLAMSLTAIGAGTLSVQSDATHDRKFAVSGLIRFIVARGVAAAFALFGIGALLVSLTLMVNFADVMTLFNQLNPGYSGFLGLTVLSIGYLPVLAVWALAYLVGAGFSIGPDVMISPFIPVTAPTQLPPFPPLAILPEQAGAGIWLLPVLVIALGVVWGIGVSLRQAKENPLMRLVIALAISIIAALIVMALSALSLGDLGDVRLVGLGPSPTLVGSLTWLLLSVGMIPAAMVPAAVFKRSRRRPQMSVVPDE